MGFSFITGQETVVHADNASFDGTERSGRLLLDGQLWIGSSSLPHVVKNTLTAGTGIVITNGSGSITVSANGAVVGQTITGDSGGALSPTAGNWDILGQQAGSIAVMDTVGTAPSTLRIEDRTWISSIVVDPSSTVGLRGTYQTITAALAAASSGQTIYVRPGNYIENITLKAGVDICALTGSGYSNNVQIRGTISCSYAGRATISGCQLISGDADGITVSGASATILTIKDCVLSQNAGSGTHYSIVCSNSNAEIYVFDCFGTTSSFGAWFNISAGLFKCQGCNLSNNGNSTINNTFSGASTNSFILNSAIGTDETIGTGFDISAGRLNIVNCNISGVITTSGTSALYLDSTRIFTPGSTALTSGGSGSHEAYQCELISNNASAVSVSNTLSLSNCTINSTSTNAITGAGTVQYGGLIFVASSSLMNTTTQTPLVRSNDAIKIKSPGAYPYTTVPQDELILVDTSSARTITPLASPTTGQKHIIKDSVGSAATNNITITPSGKNIDGAASYTMNINYGSVTIVYNGSEWSII